ncbi:MAG TPA: metallopeptidase TldD-related protein [Candidatus Angelobacter sp.]|nr:metallopeptidase TldD-related protein [Candidatus Angelobacter sp.]
MPLLKPVVVGLFLVSTFAPSFAQTKKAAKAESQAAKTSAPASPNPVLLQAMQQELDRAMAALSKADPAPYFISYSAREQSERVMVASQGAILTNFHHRDRLADISVRIGSPDLDNTHGSSRASGIITTTLPLEDKPDVIARVLWLNTDRMYKRATQTYLKVKTNTKVRAEEEDSSADFSKEKPETAIGPAASPITLDEKAWQDKLRRYSEIFAKYPEIESSQIVLQVENPTHYFVSTEGSRIVTSRPLVRILALASTRAADGMELARSETFDASSLDKLASDDVITAKIQKIAEDLAKLKKAPVVEPFSGPAMLSGRAAAVFFHEVVGHRLEGQRQRGDDEGQTFTKKINQPVLPSFISIDDDPTKSSLEGIELSGKYDYDSEGQKSQRVELVSDGVLKQFLMSRMPVKGFEHSNGHGRAQDSRMPVGRQGNLIVRSSKTVPDSELRSKLIELVKEQNKPYGLYFEDIAGGFTLTLRNMPQAFKIMPLLVWKVYPDGRPDELVRGVDIIGTPLTALNRIVTTGTKIDVFNGECGAESGSVPVSAAAPAMIFSEIEVQKMAQGHDRPPVLPPPTANAEDKSASSKDHNDPVLKAMLAELKRSQEKLQLGELQRPYYIDYQVTELQGRRVDAMLGALRDEQEQRARIVRVVVRIGDHKQDSYFGQGMGTAERMPLDDNEVALRHQLWLATDRAYKDALNGLSAKQAALKSTVVDQPVPDFSEEKPVESVGDLAKPASLEAWEQRVRATSDLFRSDPELETSGAGIEMRVINRYSVNTEGTVTRSGKTFYNAGFSGSTQASDGMRIERSHSYIVNNLDELPSPEQVQKDAKQLIATFSDLRKAPLVEDQYRGPVLLSADAASDVFASLFVPNILAVRPAPGSPARTRGEYASYYKSRVLPDFFTVTDDPSPRKVGNLTLLGSYEVDDEGVKAAPVTVVEKGILKNYLVGREPIRDFLQSNGRGRAGLGGLPRPEISNLIFKASNGVAFEELKKKLIQMCTDQGRPYGYYVETLGPQLTPRLLWRIYANDGHMELVRGAVFNRLDTRALNSDIMAAGNDEYVSSLVDPVNRSIVAPSLLFSELEIQRANRTRDKLPDYPAPALSAGGK